MSRKVKKSYYFLHPLLVACSLLFTFTSCHNQSPPPSGECPPTPYDEMGPFYKPDTPVRSSVGSGYQLEGQVKSAGNCRILAGAKIEFWLVNEKSEYDDDHRATVFSDRKGRYSFESNRPTDYVGRMPHIHIKVSARGHETLITQHYPQKGQSKGHFDLILNVISRN